MPRMNERYRRFVEKMRGPERAHRRIVECARLHGTGSTARWSGAATVQRLLKRADEGRPVVTNPGPEFRRADRRRIIAVKRPHPEEGSGLLQERFRPPSLPVRLFRVDAAPWPAPPRRPEQGL